MSAITPEGIAEMRERPVAWHVPDLLDALESSRAEVQRLQMERDTAIDERNAWRSGDQDSRIEADRLRGEIQRLTEERDSLRNYTDSFPHLWELMRTVPAEGKNYVEFSVHHEGVGDFCVEIIRKDRKSPHELRREAEAERDLAIKERDQLRETIRFLTTPSAGDQA